MALVLGGVLSLLSDEFVGKLVGMGLAFNAAVRSETGFVVVASIWDKVCPLLGLRVVVDLLGVRFVLPLA